MYHVEPMARHSLPSRSSKIWNFTPFLFVDVLCSQPETPSSFGKSEWDRFFVRLFRNGQSAAQVVSNIFMLQHLEEVEEPFSRYQIWSSVEPCKRNPFRCEQSTSLSCFVQSLVTDLSEIARTQWLERTSENLASRGLLICKTSPTTDSILQIMFNVPAGLILYQNVTAIHLEEERSSMATESILMTVTIEGG